MLPLTPRGIGVKKRYNHIFNNILITNYIDLPSLPRRGVRRTGWLINHKRGAILALLHLLWLKPMPPAWPAILKVPPGGFRGTQIRPFFVPFYLNF
jgi:hypothetical protein